MLFARQDVLQQLESNPEICKIEREKKVGDVLSIGRAQYEEAFNEGKLGHDLILKISRAHFEIHCLCVSDNSAGDPSTTEEEKDNISFWLEDKSGNGTFLNGRRVKKESKIVLADGDKICIVVEKLKKSQEFGYTFKLVYQQKEPTEERTEEMKKLEGVNTQDDHSDCNHNSEVEKPTGSEEITSCASICPVPRIVVTPPPSPCSLLDKKKEETTPTKTQTCDS